MTQHTRSTSPARAGSPWESYLVLGAVAILAVLAVADRFTAWLIGEFPTSATLWELRFEYLRPVGVYYDLAMRLGYISSLAFCGIVLAAATMILTAEYSRIRLLRGLAYHLLCGLAVILWACSLEYREGVYAPGGGPSALYAMVGAALALPAAALCIGIHAEYMGWQLAASTVLHRWRVVARRADLRLDGALSDLLDRFGAAFRPRRTMRAALLVDERSRRLRDRPLDFRAR